MLSISLDSNSEDWFSAIEKDGLKWTQALADADGKLEKKFDVRFIPMNYLINPEGKIIGKDLSMEELKRELELIFGAF